MQTIVKRGQKIILVGNLKALAKIEAALEQYSLGHYGLKGKENQTWLDLSKTTKC